MLHFVYDSQLQGTFILAYILAYVHFSLLTVPLEWKIDYAYIKKAQMAWVRGWFVLEKNGINQRANLESRGAPAAN